MSTVATPPTPPPPPLAPRAGGPGSLPPLPPPPPEPPRRGLSLPVRFLLAGLGVILLSAGATVTVALNEVGKIVDALGQTKAVHLAPNVLAPTARGAPQTLLLVGNDERPPPKSNPYGKVLRHSNEMLLVRIDPSKPTVSMLSIPRELQVTFTAPSGQVITNRINSAYTYGGIQLMTETIKRVLGVQVNHVFAVTFPKFRRAVNEMGCVYMTVDRRYYHVNEPGGEQYFEINLQPGYQRMCGGEALEFVANRHEDTSLTRDARDQRFLLEVKNQYGPSLFENREKFEKILGKAVETDLHGTGQVLDLLELLVESQGKPVRQVPFHVNLLPSFDTASPEQIGEAVHAFLGGTAAISHAHIPGAPSASSSHGHSSHHHYAPPSAASLGLTPTPAAALTQARTIAPDLPFPLEYPKIRDTYAGASEDLVRRYDIRDQQGVVHPIYAIVVNRAPLGQYYDVQGTDWTDPPLLSGSSQTVHAGSRTYELFYAGEQVRLVAWHEAGATYWIQNTLTNGVSARTMLTLAEHTTPVIGSVGGYTAHAVVSPSNVPLPKRTSSSEEEDTLSKVGSLLGFAGLLAVGLLALLVFVRHREILDLREQVARAMALEARQRPVLAGAGTGTEPPPRAAAVAAAATHAPSTPAFAERRPTIYRAAPGRGWLLSLALIATLVLAVVIVLAVRLLGG